MWLIICNFVWDFCVCWHEITSISWTASQLNRTPTVIICWASDRSFVLYFWLCCVLLTDFSASLLLWTFNYLLVCTHLCVTLLHSHFFGLFVHCVLKNAPSLIILVDCGVSLRYWWVGKDCFPSNISCVPRLDPPLHPPFTALNGL